VRKDTGQDSEERTQDRTERIGLPGQDSHDRTAATGQTRQRGIKGTVQDRKTGGEQPGKDCRDRQPQQDNDKNAATRKGAPKRTPRTGWPEQDIQNETARKIQTGQDHQDRQPEKDYQEITSREEQPEQGRKDKATRKGAPEEDIQNSSAKAGQPKQGSHDHRWAVN
jgi:hypothetical protein